MLRLLRNDVSRQCGRTFFDLTHAFRIEARKGTRDYSSCVVPGGLLEGQHLHAGRAKKKWASPEGRLKLLNFLQVNHPHMDASGMTPQWWTAHVEGRLSSLSSTCRVCGFHTVPLLGNIMSGRGFPCVCNGNARWGTRSGFDRLKSILDSTRFAHIDHSAIDWNWWQHNILGNVSKLTVVCRSCGYHAESTTSRLVNGQEFHCLCGSGLRWASRGGFERVKLTLNRKRFQHINHAGVNWNWWQHEVQNNQSKVSVMCRKCGYQIASRICWIVSGHVFNCGCTGNARWATRGGFDRCKAILDNDERFVHIDHSDIDWNWWQHNVRNSRSKLSVVCRACKQNATARLNDVTHKGQGFGCACQNKTERKLLEWLEERYETVEREVGGCRNPSTGRTLPFDFCIRKRILIELDGWLHFCGTDFSGNACDAHPKRDYFKERWAMKTGHVLIRVLQKDVWNDLNDWQTYMLRSIAEAETDTEPRIILPHAAEYKTGIYFDLRAGRKADVATEIFGESEYLGPHRRRD
ncbi:unnamed protein product, partial [Polarella glacialis]